MAIYFKKKPQSKSVKSYLSLDKFPLVKGYDFEQQFNFDQFTSHFISMCFQGSHLGNAIEIFEELLKEKKKGLQIWVSFTGNMISSGNRELLVYLVKNRIVDGITTTASALEEDIVKCIKPFHVGSFEIPGKFLHDECIGRIGNILVPYDRYLYLEEFVNEFYPLLQKKIKGGPCTS